MEAVCDHLQAVYNFTVPEKVDPKAKLLPKIKSIVINEPPRCTKSLLTSVLFNAWVWTRWPAAKFLCITYSDDLAKRDSLRTRNLVESSWYKSRWPSIVMDQDQRAKERFNIVGGGFRVSTTILGMATGEGGDFRILDDPLNVRKALSDSERKQANIFVDLTLPTRVVDPKRSSTIVCMQRLHEDDVSGHLLNSSLGYEHLCLPMEYEGTNQCSTSLGFVDPRTEEGELLHPSRWDRSSVEFTKDALRLEFGDFGINSQLQQRPTPMGGGLFKTENLVLIPSYPPLKDLDRIVRYWDKAGSDGSGDSTSGALLARRRSNNRTVILDIVNEQAGADRREELIRNTAFMDMERFGGNSGTVKIIVEQEPGSGGKDSALWTITKTLAGFSAEKRPKSTSKEVDWAPLASQVGIGAVEIVQGLWNDRLKHQMASAPFGKHDDDLDSTSGGFKYIWLSKRAGVWGK